MNIVDENIGFLEQFKLCDSKGKCMFLVELLKQVETIPVNAGYERMIDVLVDAISKVLDKIDGGEEIEDDAILFIERQYNVIIGETKKYQVMLVGSGAECADAYQYMNLEICHLVGNTVFVDLERDAVDYFVVCGAYKNIDLIDERVIRWDFLRLCFWGISPETAYININREKKKPIYGAVTGLSYQQRGINWERIGRGLCCLATPSEDLYVDFKKFVWFNERNDHNLKYCILGMSDYAFWYDMSLSKETQLRMLCYYDMIRNVHHFHDFDEQLLMWRSYKDVLNTLFIQNYDKLDYQHTVHPEALFNKENKTEYVETDSNRDRDTQEVIRLFSKPYEKTYCENKKILELFLKYLFMNKIKTITFFPPFPTIFRRNISATMQQRTHELLGSLKEKYKFDILDLTYDEDFTDDLFCDCSHLNDAGADLVTDKINSYMEKIWS